MSKRPAALGLEGVSTKKHKAPFPSLASRTGEANDNSQSRKEVKEWIKNLAHDLEKHDECAPLDERHEITSEIDDGSHVLILEHNTSKSAKCRATACAVNETFHHLDERIHSPYRFCLEAVHSNQAHWTQLDKPNRRFYHISCFEAIGVDIANHLLLPPERELRPNLQSFGISRQRFHPAIVDWIANKGKSFHATRYGEYEDLLENYDEEIDSLLRSHWRICSAEKCECTSVPTRPKSSDVIEGEPSQWSLSDVLLQVLGADQSMLLSGQARLMLLDLQFLEPRWEEVLARQNQQEVENKDRAAVVGDGSDQVDSTARELRCPDE